MSDDKRATGNIRRVTAKDRKDKLEYGQNLFPPDQPLPPDPQAAMPQPDAPLPFDEAAFAAQAAERFPPLPFDGEEPQAVQAHDAERFPPLPPPVWARQDIAEPEFELDESDFATEPGPQPAAAQAAPPPARRRRPEPKPRPKTSRKRGCLYNLLTLVFFVLTVAALVYGVHIFNNPYSSLNPLPPPTALPIIITATPEPQPIAPVLPAETSTPDDAAPADEIAAPTPDPQPTATYTPLPPEVLTELAPTQEAFTGEQAAT